MLKPNNICIFTGRLVATPEIKVLKTEKGDLESVSFSLGIDKGFGEKKRTIFPRFVAYGVAAKLLAKCEKGMKLTVCGEYDIKEYHTQSGEKRFAHEFSIESVEPHWNTKQEAGKESIAAPEYAQQMQDFESLREDDDVPF
jgi:single-stranded DNA-binding protein